jgi:cytochrome c oxidase subunit 1
MQTVTVPVHGGEAHHDHGHATDHGHEHHHQSFISKYIFSTDHKMIARQFMFSALLFLFIGGAFAMFIRWQLAFPGQAIPVIGNLLPESWVTDGAIHAGFFTQLLTMHGTIMIFFAIIPFQVGLFGNLCIPLMIGTDDMAFPRLNMISFWLTPPAGLIVMAGFMVEGGSAAAGWTSYPPLSAIAGSGQTLWLIAVFMVGFSSIAGAVNYITTVLNKRAPGMKMFQLPTTVWAIFITSVIIVLGTPVLAAAVSMLFMDQALHSSFFLPDNLVTAKKFAGGGQPILWQHLFWFYSHPAVYIMIVPTMGVVSDVLATFARKPIYGYKAMVFAIMAIAFLGFIVWGHHMFQSGMNPLLGTTFMLSTIVIAVPSSIKVFNWLGTIWKGNIRFTTAMLNALGFIGTFVIGGLSGIFMAAAPVDIYIHDTYFIVAHIHYVLFGGSLFGIFSGIYYWYPKMFGKMLSESLGRKHFFWTFTLFNLTFFPMHVLGIGGHIRRVYDPYVYDFLKPFQDMNVFISLCAFALGLAQLILVFNIFWSMKYGKKAPRNPWKANSLEWAAPSPPPHGNFDRQIHVYRGPYEFSLPDMVEDYLPQWIERTPDVKQAEKSGQHSAVSAEFSSGGYAPKQENKH